MGTTNGAKVQKYEDTPEFAWSMRRAADGVLAEECRHIARQLAGIMGRLEMATCRVADPLTLNDLGQEISRLQDAMRSMLTIAACLQPAEETVKIISSATEEQKPSHQTP